MKGKLSVIIEKFSVYPERRSDPESEVLNISITFCENWKFAGGSWGNDLSIAIQIRH